MFCLFGVNGFTVDIRQHENGWQKLSKIANLIDNWKNVHPLTRFSYFPGIRPIEVAK